MFIKKEQPLISVIIPVYNVENFVEEAVISICNQTYRNLEIIIIDDCSTDNTYNIIKSISYFDSRIILLRNDVNLKIVKSLNKGLGIAKGEYIARMDGDDISYPHRIEKQFNFLMHNPDIALVGCQVDTINENGQKIGKTKLPIQYNNILKTITYSSPILHIWLVKKQVYLNLAGYREILGAEDYDFLLRMVSLGYQISNLPSYEYAVRIRDGNTSSTIGFTQQIMSHYAVSLFKERQEHGNDSYSINNRDKIIKENQKYSKNYTRSNFLLNKAFIAKANKSYLFMMIYLMYSIFKSKYQIKYLFNRTLAKFLSR